MAVTPRFSVEQRRIRLARRHHLATETAALDVHTVARQMVGLHATDPATVYLSARRRVPGFEVAHLEAALYDDRLLQRHMGVRRTMFTLPIDLVPMVQAAASDPIGRAVRTRLVKELEHAGIGGADGATCSDWLDATIDATVGALVELGPSTGSQLSAAVPQLRTKLTSGNLDAAVTTRVLTLMALEGRVVRDRPTGSWTSSLHRWRPAEAVAAGPLDRMVATTDLVDRWLRAFGPAPVDDIVWWTGLGLTKVRAALIALAAVTVDLDGEAGIVRPGVALANDVEPDPPVSPWVALLPSLDPTPMGWKTRDWYLGEHTGALFDRTGNIGPTVWSNGRIIGGWSQRRSEPGVPGGEVRFRIFDDVGAEVIAAVTAEAATLQQWLGSVVVSPRFPTPTDVALRGV